MGKFSLSSLRSSAIGLVLVAILPLLGLILYSYFNQRDQVIREVQRDGLVAVRNLAAAQETIFSNTKNLLTTIARRPEVQRRDRNACNLLFAELKKQSPYIAGIVATNSEGQLFASALPTPSPVTFADRPWFQKVKQTRDLVLGETVVGRISGQYGNILAWPILDGEGRFVGALAAQFNLNWLPGLLAKSDFPPTTAIVLTDFSRKVLWRYPEPEKYLGQMLPEAFMKPMAAGDEGIAAGRGLPGDSRLFAFARLSPPWQDFWVTIGLQRDWAISPVNRILWRNLMFLGLVALLSMAAAWYAGNFFIVRPVMKLLTVVERLASGDLSVRAGPDYQVGELGLLAQSFDHMADSLKEREEALRQAHDELEERVAERTAILRLTNEQLVWEIEERQRVEDRLRESEAHFAAFMEHLPGLAVMRDMEGRYLFANHAWEELMGLEPGAWQGKTLAELWPLEQATNLQKLDFEIISSRRPMEQVEMLEQEDGPHYYLSKRFPITDKDDLPYMVGGISIDVTDRQRAEAALKGSEEKLRYLAEQLLTTQENERKRLAAALHDELGHALLALKLHVSSIAKKIGPEQKELQEGVLAQLDHINEVIQEVRRLYYDLSPGDVEDLGLTKALRTLIREFAGHVPQVTWQVDLADLEGLFSLPVQTIIYRTMQEALTNIGKHSHPTLVTISSKKEPSQVNFVVQDNGIGFDPQELGSRGSGRGVGLVAMEERLNMIGGSFEIHSRDQEGTRLSFTIPILQEGDKP